MMPAAARLRLGPVLTAAILLVLTMARPGVGADLKTGAPAQRMSSIPHADTLAPIRFDDIPGWRDDDQAAAVATLARHCAETGGSVRSDVSRQVCALLEQAKAAATPRAFFEQHFQPYRVVRPGFVTGYFEPELPASRIKTSGYSVPLLRAPKGAVSVTRKNRPDHWPPDLSHGRKIKNGIVPLPDRGAIMDGALDAEKLELVWLKDPVDAFFVHVQGSARLLLDDGTVMRVGYAGKTGHPYRSIARILVERGEGTPEQMTMAGLRAWLAANPDRRDGLLRENRSYIFFREIEMRSGDGPIGAAGVPLTAGRSLAVDSAYVPLGLPVFVASDLGDPDRAGTSFRRLMVAQDTGSAIKGSGRGDIFVGSGDAAGAVAGEIRHAAVMVLLLPKSALGAASTADQAK